MPVLGPPQGLFSVHDSDHFVGSMFMKGDIIEILGISENDLKHLPFKSYMGVETIDERELQRYWYSGSIPNAPLSRVGSAKISFDEIVLIKLIEITYPNATIESQVPWGRKRIDLRVTVGRE